MLARFRVLLPFAFSIPQDAKFQNEEFDRDGYRFRVYPPYPASTSIGALEDPSLPVSDVLQRLHPTKAVVVDQGITIDGANTVRANAMQIDVYRPNFDRRAATDNFLGSNDPPIELLFGVVNSYLDRARSVGRAHVIHRVEATGSCWRIEFLSDS